MWQKRRRSPVAHAEVDEFLRTYVYPSLKTAGFRRKGREASITGPEGRIGYVAFSACDLPQAPGFYCAYGMVTPSHLAWWEGRNASPSSVPLFGLALVMVQVVAPDPVRAFAAAARNDWWGLYPDVDKAELGHQIGEILVEQVIPDVKSWFDAEALAVDIAQRRDGLTPLMDQRHAEAMAWLDVKGAEERVERAIATLPPDDMVREWMEARLAARSAD
jgi:hypothetical protein